MSISSLLHLWLSGTASSYLKQIPFKLPLLFHASIETFFWHVIKFMLLLSFIKALNGWSFSRYCLEWHSICIYVWPGDLDFWLLCSFNLSFIYVEHSVSLKYVPFLHSSSVFYPLAILWHKPTNMTINCHRPCNIWMDLLYVHSRSGPTFHQRFFVGVKPCYKNLAYMLREMFSTLYLPSINHDWSFSMGFMLGMVGGWPP